MPGVIEMAVAPVTCQHNFAELPASMVDGVTTNTTIWGTVPVDTVMVTGAVTVWPSLEVADSVEVVVCAGDTVVLPFRVTAPTPLMETVVAPEVVQLRVD